VRERESVRSGGRSGEPVVWRLRDSGGRRTECAGLPSEVDVQARHEELTCTHGLIVRNKPYKVN
jgi:hypothetical protein